MEGSRENRKFWRKEGNKRVQIPSAEGSAPPESPPKSKRARKESDKNIIGDGQGKDRGSKSMAEKALIGSKEEEWDEGSVDQEPVAGPSYSIGMDILNMDSTENVKMWMEGSFLTAGGVQIPVTDVASYGAELIYKNVLGDKKFAKWMEKAEENEGVTKREQNKKEEVQMEEAEINEYVSDFLSDGEWEETDGN